MLSKILVAIDQSTVSQWAFEAALELAQALGSELIIVRVLNAFEADSPEKPMLPVNSYAMELDDILRKTYERQCMLPVNSYAMELDDILRKTYERQWAEYVDHSEALLRQRQSEAQAAGVTASYLQPYGRPGPELCEAARNSCADLIVVGSHGRSGLQAMILGSVSNHIMHHAPCSVMVIHPDGRPEHVLRQQRSELAAAAMS